MKRPRTSISAVLQSKVLFLILLVFVVMSGIRLSNEIARRAAIAQEVRALKERIAVLRTDRDSLTSLLDTFSKPDYIEEEARKKLNMARPGESVVVVPLKEETQNDRESSPQLLPAPHAWWNYFFAYDEAIAE